MEGSFDGGILHSRRYGMVSLGNVFCDYMGRRKRSGKVFGGVDGL